MHKHLIAAAVAAAIGGVSAPGAAEAQELVIATFGGSFKDNVEACYIEPFEEATGATVLVTVGNSAQHAASVRASAGQPGMDVVFADDAFAAQLVAEELLQPLDRSKLSNAEHIIDGAWGPGDAYVTAMLSATTIIYNTETVETPPTSWADLFDEKWAGRIAIGDVTGTSGWQFLAAVNRLAGGTIDDVSPGIEMIKPLAESAVLLYTQADQVVALFERGEIDVAVWYPDRAIVASQKGIPLAVSYPEEGAIAIRPTISIPKGAQNPELALAFIDTVLAAENQKCFSERNFIGSVNTQVELSDEVAAVVPSGEALENLIFLDPAAMSKKLPDWTRRWQREVLR